MFTMLPMVNKDEYNRFRISEQSASSEAILRKSWA